MKYIILYTIWVACAVLALGLVRTYVYHWKKKCGNKNFAAKFLCVFAHIYFPVMGPMGLLAIIYVLGNDGYPKKLFYGRMSVMQEVYSILYGP
jgi:hypothetical protein